MSKRDFLVEIGTEELPPKSLFTLAQAFASGIGSGLDQDRIQNRTPRCVRRSVTLDWLSRAINNDRPEIETVVLNRWAASSH